MVRGKPETWTVPEVGAWLEGQGFGQYKAAFTHHKISGDILLLLSEKDLKEDLKITVIIMIIIIIIYYFHTSITCLIQSI